jgi:hypothetical protein
VEWWVIESRYNGEARVDKAAMARFVLKGFVAFMGHV